MYREFSLNHNDDELLQWESKNDEYLLDSPAARRERKIIRTNLIPILGSTYIVSRWTNSVFYCFYEWSSTIYIYLWIAKDLCWTQSWFYLGIASACAAVLWSVTTLAYHIWRRDFRNSWLHLAEFAWLLANFLWMYGELHDERLPLEKPLEEHYTRVSGELMEAALCWLLLFYVLLHPLRALQLEPPEAGGGKAEGLGAVCWSPSHYEDLHVLFWLGKDCAWNHMNLALWYLFLVPTLLVAADFVWTACRKVWLATDSTLALVFS